MQQIGVRSETGALRRLFLHDPGPEVERALPWPLAGIGMARQQLWAWPEAQRDYNEFVGEITNTDPSIEILWVRRLLREILEDPDLRERRLRELLGDSQILETYRDGLVTVGRSIRSISPADVAEHLIGGWPRMGTDEIDETGIDRIVIWPARHLTWLRDTAVVLPSGAVICELAEPHRVGEAAVIRALFRYHQALETNILLDFPLENARHTGRPSTERLVFEGGNVLVLNGEAVVVGYGAPGNTFSTRTSLPAVELLANRLFTDTSISRVYSVRVPDLPGFIHLDTVLTLFGHKMAVAMPYLFGFPKPWPAVFSELLRRFYVGGTRSSDNTGPWCPDRLDGGAGEVCLYERTICGPRAVGKSLLACLEDEGVLELDRVAFIGGDPEDFHNDAPMHLANAMWEQRQMGGNVFSLGPRETISFRRARRTLRSVMRRLRTPGERVVAISGGELVKAGGGPRCLTLPLCRS